MMLGQDHPAERRMRVGAVSFLNALPLIDGLDARPDVTIVRAVPAALPGMLDRGELDVALVPVIDLLRRRTDWRIVSDACIASEGATLTVRVFSRVDPRDVHTLFVDADSHTSVSLAAIVWRERYGQSLRLEPFHAGKTSPAALAHGQAVLLIGDKVIQPPLGMDVFSTQIDLGATWRSLTGLPFVFAVWATPDGHLDTRVAGMLAAARDAGVAAAGSLAERHGPRMGWPASLARSYLTEHLSYTLTDRHREGMQRFFDLVERYSLLNRIEEPIVA